MTSFETIINRFLGKVTDDMYLELTEEDTIRDAKQILLDAIPYFEFPRFALYNYDEEQGVYNVDLTQEEINIFALCMKQAWLDRQINSVENTRMKYSGSDFKFTSQANHLAKLLNLKTENQRENIHAQRLYKRRTYGHDGRVMSNWSVLNQSALSSQNSPKPGSDSSSSSSVGTLFTEAGNVSELMNPTAMIAPNVVITPTEEVSVNGSIWEGITGDEEIDPEYVWKPIKEE